MPPQYQYQVLLFNIEPFKQFTAWNYSTRNVIVTVNKIEYGHRENQAFFSLIQKIT